MALFLSTVLNKMDSKCRVSVPSNFRNSLKNQSFKGVVAFPSYNDNSIDFHGTNDFTTRFVKCYIQPEPFIDISFYNKAAESETNYMGVGKSGQLYVGGYGGWSSLGTKNNYSMDGWLKLRNQ